MSSHPIPSPHLGEEDDSFFLDTYVDLNTPVPPENGFMSATTSLKDLGPNPYNFVSSDALDPSSSTTGGSSMEVPSFESDTTMTWIPRDMQISHNPQLDLSTACRDSNGTAAGYNGHPQHHASQVSTHHIGKLESATNYPSGTGHTSIYQPFLKPDYLLRGRLGDATAGAVNRRLGPHSSPATTASTYTGLHRCDWNGCHPPRYFARDADLMRHIRSIHVSPGAHSCRGCGKRFGRKDHLDLHEGRCRELRLDTGHRV